VDVKRRFALAAFLVVLGLALPLAAVAKKGAPWGFRGHRGVVVEATNDATLTDNEGNRKPGDRGTWLAVGDEVRAGRFSELRGRLPEGRFAVSDGGVVKITEKGLLLSGGALEVIAPKGNSKVTVEVEGQDAPFQVRPGTEDGHARFLTDGKGTVFGSVKGGSLENGANTAEPGQIVVLAGGTSAVRPGPGAIQLSATCDGTSLVVTTGAGVQVFAPGSAKVSDGTPLTFDAPGKTEVQLMARDIMGNVSPVSTVTCTKPGTAPVPPKPAPKPAPKP
jgi:hypothetical protein